MNNDHSKHNNGESKIEDGWLNRISQQENPRVAAALIIDAPRRDDAGLRGEPLIVRGGPRSSLARRLGIYAEHGQRAVA